jgi:hypothetical protein
LLSEGQSSIVVLMDPAPVTYAFAADVIGLEVGDGTAEVMKMVVARQLLGREV